MTQMTNNIICGCGGMVDTTGLEPVAERRGGSSPSTRTKF